MRRLELTTMRHLELTAMRHLELTTMRHLRLIIILAIICSVIFSLGSLGSLVSFASSNSDTMSLIIEYLREGDESEVRELNMQLPDIYDEEECVKYMSSGMKAAYRAEINKWEKKKEHGIDVFYDYWLTDIDNDGNAELLLALWPDHAAARTVAYTYKNGKLKELGYVGGEVFCSAYPGNNGIIVEHCYMGYDSFTLVTLVNNQLNIEELNMFELDEYTDYIYLGNKLKSHSKYKNGRYVPVYDVLDGGMPKSKKLKCKYDSSDTIIFKWGTDLFKDNANAAYSYDINLAKAAIYLCDGTYHGEYETEQRMKKLGLSDPRSEYYEVDNQTNTSPITVASDRITINGDDYLFIAAAVRGTNDTWDFVTDLRLGIFNVDGFAEAGETGMEIVRGYWNEKSTEYGFDREHTILFVTGHSLGAAIAGQIAGNLQDEIAEQNHIFTYTFASPYYETHGKDVSGFKNIHNLINGQDAVPKFPLGGVRYGKDRRFAGDGKDMLDQHMLSTYYRFLEKSSVKSTSITKLVKAKRAITVKWKKQPDMTGYQIQYSLKKGMKSSKKIAIGKSSKTKFTIRKLKHNRKYYVRIRTYKKAGGTTYYSGWSKIKSKKTK